MVNGETGRTGINPMATALKYLGQITSDMFETQMKRAAQKICERQGIFSRRNA
jgi:hypothetical protein